MFTMQQLLMKEFPETNKQHMFVLEIYEFVLLLHNKGLYTGTLIDAL